MSLALYRKYRPATFGEVIGQEHVTEPLIQALRSGRLHHAYLFSGPRGCGKTSSARILARSLNCAAGPTPEPCGSCESCRALSKDGQGSIDVIEIDAASHGGVDDARELRERAFYMPVSGRYKIYVIDEAHMVSSAGFNALLKLVEEPPEYVKFVFATTEPEKVLATIRSRTHHYPFRLVPPSVMRPHLEQLCQAEQVAVEPAVFPLVVRAGGGSVRDSLSVLDQLIAGAGPAGVTYSHAAALLGVTDATLLDELCDALAAGDGAAMFATVDRVAEAGHDARRFAADLLERLRDLIIIQQVPDAAAKGLLDVPADQWDRMSAHAHQLGLGTLSRCADIVHNGLVEMRGTASPRLLLELVCARMLLPGASDGDDGLAQRLDRLERRLGATGYAPTGSPQVSAVPPARGGDSPHAAGPGAGPAASAGVEPAAGAGVEPAGDPEPVADAAPVPAASAAGPATDPVPEPVAAVPAQPGTVDAAAIRRVWEEIIATIGRRSKRAAAVVREATVRDVEGDTIVLHFQHAVHAQMLSSAPEPLLTAVEAVLGGRWQVRCETGEDGRRSPQIGAPRPQPTGAAADPAPSATEPGEVDWPEPARPGGNTPSAASPGAPDPGAASASLSGAPPGAAGAPASTGAAADRTATAGVPPPTSAGAGRTVSAGAAAAVAAATSPAVAAGSGFGPVATGPVAAATGPATAVPPPPRLPGAPATGSPDDGVDEIGDARADPFATGKQALQLLQQTLGAERIAGGHP